MLWLFVIWPASDQHSWLSRWLTRLFFFFVCFAKPNQIRYDAKQELRRQLGYMSGDMDTLIANSKDKKAAGAMKKSFFVAVDNLDFAIRKKDKESGLKYQDEAVAKLNDFIAFTT